MFLIGAALESIASGQRPYGLDTLPPIGPYLNNTMPLAFATRRVESIHAAHAILTRAASLHPTDSTIQFNPCLLRGTVGQTQACESAPEASDRGRPQVQIDGALRCGPGAAVGILTHGQGMNIIEVRPSKKFKGCPCSIRRTTATTKRKQFLQISWELK
jgi:hypothetical protein